MNIKLMAFFGLFTWLPLVAKATAEPAWVLQPKVNGGVAATACIPTTASPRIDRRIAKMAASADLAKQFQTTVWVANEMTTRSDDNGSAVQFSEQIRIEVSKHLTGVSIIHDEEVSLNATMQRCVMVAIKDSDVRYAFEQTQLTRTEQQRLFERYQTLSTHQ